MLADVLGHVLTAAGEHAGVRTSEAPAPLAAIRGAGARFLGIDAELLASAPEDDLGEALEDGMGLLVLRRGVELGRFLEEAAGEEG